MRYKVTPVAQASRLHKEENMHEKSRQDACATKDRLEVVTEKS